MFDSDNSEKAPKLNGHAGSWVWYVKQDRLIGDERLAEIYGVDPKQAQIGISFDNYLAAVNLEDRAELLAALARSLEYCCEYQVAYRVKAHEREIWVLAIGRCFDDPGGKRHVGLALEITELKSTERDHPMHQLDAAAQHCLSAHQLCQHPQLKNVKESIGIALKKIGMEIARGIPRR